MYIYILYYIYTVYTEIFIKEDNKINQIKIRKINAHNFNDCLYGYVLTE